MDLILAKSMLSEQTNTSNICIQLMENKYLLLKKKAINPYNLTQASFLCATTLLILSMIYSITFAKIFNIVYRIHKWKWKD